MSTRCDLKRHRNREDRIRNLYLEANDMINPDLSFGVAQKAADYVTKKFLLSAYETSDDAYWQRHGTRSGWQSLGGIIEYLPHFLAITDEGDRPVYLFMLRAAPNLDLKRVKIKIKVRKAGEIHEQTICVDRLGRVPVRKALDEIPLRPKPSSKQGRKLGNVYIKLVEALDGDGVDLVAGAKIASIFSPGRIESANHRFAKRWGQYWNVDEINIEKNDFKTHCYRRLVQSAGQLWRPLRGRRVAYSIMTSDLGLSVAFWSQNLFDAKGLRASMSDVVSQHKSMKRDRIGVVDDSGDASCARTAVSA